MPKRANKEIKGESNSININGYEQTAIHEWDKEPKQIVTNQIQKSINNNFFRR